MMLVFIVVVIAVLWIYRRSKRITSMNDLCADVHGLELSGIATFVFDGDGFKFFHTPWWSSSEYTKKSKTLRVRLAGIDAPESGSFGYSSQPFSLKAKHELMNLVLGKKVKIKLLGIDRYDRLLAMCYIENWFSRINVNMKMVEIGMACVYKGKDAVYDDNKDEFIMLEDIAREEKLGMWSRGDYISPMDYKKMTRK